MKLNEQNSDGPDCDVVIPFALYFRKCQHSFQVGEKLPSFLHQIKNRKGCGYDNYTIKPLHIDMAFLK